jgi:hypothetical protein
MYNPLLAKIANRNLKTTPPTDYAHQRYNSVLLHSRTVQRHKWSCTVHGSISILSFFLSPFFFSLVCPCISLSLSVSSFHKSSATRPSENCSELQVQGSSITRTWTRFFFRSLSPSLTTEPGLRRSPFVQFPAAVPACLASRARTSFVSLIGAPEVLGYGFHRHLDGQFRTGEWDFSG